jgi:carbon monoxide dehydrogenase subunit G
VPQARAARPTAQAGEAAPTSAPTSPPDEAGTDGFGGVQLLEAPLAQVWPALLDPGTLQRSLPGCEALVQTRADTYEARVKVGLGPLSVRFSTEVQVRNPHPPQSLTLVFTGQAGALGSGQGTAEVRLEHVGAARTRLHWRANVQLGGRLAQFGTRLVEATARELAGVFFERLGQTLATDSPQAPRAPRALPWWRRLLRRFRSWVAG